MNSKEAIIQKIIDDAEAVARNNIAVAEETAGQILDRAKRDVEKFDLANVGKSEAIYDDALSRSEVVANLDCKKALLNAKKALVDKAFEEAADELAADKKNYLTLIEKMIASCCEDGDEVVVCERDDKIITKKFVADLSKKVGKKISRSNEFGDFKGGVILSGKNYDKNLTLDLELSLIRESIESKIVEILFGSKN